MNMSIKKLVGLTMLLAVYTSIFPTAASAVSGEMTIEVCANDFDLRAEAEIKDRVQNMTGIVDIRFTPEVMARIKGYLQYKEGTSAILGRQNVFFPMFEEVLERRNMPTDLKYLSVVESALKPNAISRVGAAGLWQLMRSTGRMLGLKINSTIDERRSPYKSTEAALDYLEQLYEEFDDWTLALAAYNAGPGRVRRAILRANSRDFWTIQRFLPRETRNYVPAFIAANYVANYYYIHDIPPVVEHPDLLSVSNITLYEEMTFTEIAEITGVEMLVLKMLNPCYLRNYIPASINGSHVLMPKYAASLLLSHLVRPDDPQEEIQSEWYSRHLISPTDVHLLRPDIEIPEKLPMFTTPLVEDQRDDLPEMNLSPAGRTEEDAVWYRLKKRESLQVIARRKKISFEKLIELNSGWDQDLNPGSLIRLR